MKKIYPFFLILFVCLLAFSACSDNDSPNENNALSAEEQKFVGTWLLSKTTINGVEAFGLGDYVFSNDRTFETVPAILSGNWSALNNQLSLKVGSGTLTATFLFTSNNQTLTMTNNWVVDETVVSEYNKK